MRIKNRLPNIVTLLLAMLLIAPQNAWAAPIFSISSSPRAALNAFKSTISYQGYLVDADGNPVNAAALAMVFKLYNVETGGAPLWEEPQNAAVSNGLFSVLLGAVTPISTDVLANNSDLWLGIAIGSDTEMMPREKIASAPYALLANIPDGSITGPKLASDAVDNSKIANNAVTSASIQNGQVSSADVGFNYAGSSSKGGPASNLACTNCISSGEIQDGQVSSADIVNNTITEADIVDSFKARDADKLDGHDTSYFAIGNHNHDGRYFTKTQSDGRYYTKTQSDGRYYTKTQSDSRLLNVSGDTMTGILTLNNKLYLKKNLTSPSGTNIAIDPGAGSVNTLTLFDTVVIHDSFNAGGKNLMIGDDTYFSDVDIPNQLALYGTASKTFGYLKANIVNPSSRAYKTDIASLASEEYDAVLQEIKAMNLVYYHLLGEDTANDPLRLGLIAEDVPAELLGPDGAGIDLYKLASFTLAGLKALAAENQQSERLTAEGIGTLQEGSARIELDPALARSDDKNYLIHLTPYGDTSLYVAEIGESYFVVKSRGNDSDISFAWQARKVTNTASTR